jgi:hypothetical protein
MEDFTLPSVGASFKKWGCCTPILLRCQAHLHNTKKKGKKKNAKKRGVAGKGPHSVKLRAVASRPWSPNCWLVTPGRSPTVLGCPKLTLCNKFVFPPTLNFLHMWSTLVGWLQHMPALRKLLLKTSNTHNSWSVGPKNMKFVLMRSLLRDASSQKVSKNLKIKWD